jgi:hypothetical protein
MSLGFRSWSWAKRHWPELAIFSLGAFLRVSMAWTYRPEWSYDFADHWAVVTWILQRGHLPPVDALREAFHPPLFYFVAAQLLKLGVSPRQMMALPIACGTIRLALIWYGLERYLPEARRARLAALALASVTASSVHIDGMVYSEALSGMVNAAGMLLAAEMLRREPTKRWRLAIATGIVFGIAMLTKISATVVIGCIGVAAAAECLMARRKLGSKALGVLTWLATLAVCVAVCGWYFARNVSEHHQLFLTSFELPFERGVVEETNKLPSLGRRSIDFVLGWDRSIFYFPYYPSAIAPRPQFFPVAVASTFVDYWNYAFSGIEHDTPSPIHVATGALLPRVLTASQFAAIGGTVIFVATLSAWCRSLALVLRSLDFARLMLLLVPLGTLAAALHFAIKYPVDGYGVVKGVYMQFGSAPLYGLFGVSFAWLWPRRDLWPLTATLAAALWGVTTYTVYCRLHVPLLPLG